MNNSLPTDIQQRIDAQLATGAFVSEEQVLREAIDALERRQRGLKQLQDLVAVADEDVVAGRVGGFNRDDLKRDVRDRLAQQNIRD